VTFEALDLNHVCKKNSFVLLFEFFFMSCYSPLKGFCLYFNTPHIYKCSITTLGFNFIKFLVFSLLCILQCIIQANILSTIDL
jgi:hypothetical protein